MGRTLNDDCSDSMNPNNDAYDDSRDNRSNQLNPNNDKYRRNATATNSVNVLLIVDASSKRTRYARH